MDKLPVSSELKRITVNLPEHLIIEVEQAQLDLRRGGHRISFSGFIEVALRELLPSANLPGVIRRHGGSARRGAGDNRAPSGDGKLIKR